mgnify:CR=1 FL=1
MQSARLDEVEFDLKNRFTQSAEGFLKDDLYVGDGDDDYDGRSR